MIDQPASIMGIVNILPPPKSITLPLERAQQLSQAMTVDNLAKPMNTDDDFSVSAKNIVLPNKRIDRQKRSAYQPLPSNFESEEIFLKVVFFKKFDPF